MRIGFTFDSGSFVIGKKSADLTWITKCKSASVLISDLHLNFAFLLRFPFKTLKSFVYESLKNHFKILMEPTQVRIPGISDTVSHKHKLCSHYFLSDRF